VLGERPGRGVAHAAQQRVVQGVAAVVTLAVLDRTDHVPARAAGVQQQAGQPAVGRLTAPVDVIDGAAAAALGYQLDAAAVIVDVYPAPDVAAGAVERDGQ